MIRFIFPIVAIASIMGMIGCSARDPVAEDANNATATPEIDVLPPDESTTPPINGLDNGDGPSTSADQPAGAGKIPASLYGRWGLTPGDCTSNKGDTKGLLIVSADGLKFYESLGKPAGDLKTSEKSASGDFAFTGEGMNWKKFEVLELQSGKLVRTESNPMKSFAYARCDA